MSDLPANPKAVERAEELGRQLKEKYEANSLKNWENQFRWLNGASSGDKKTCKGCGKEKTLLEYPKAFTNSDGHLGKCKSCCNTRSRELALKKRTQRD